MEYLDWNQKIFSHFFNPAKEGTRVSLAVTTELIERLGKENGLTTSDFVSSVIKGPPWITNRKSICLNALQAFENWRERPDCKTPPYIAYLALFILALDHGDEFSQSAYYPRLRSILGEPQSKQGYYPAFDEMISLWDDLEKWSTHEDKGKNGEFNLGIIGNLIHVGILYAQILLSEGERKNLPHVFSSAEIIPNSEPSSGEMLEALKEFGQVFLLPRTKRILFEDHKNKELRNLILNAIFDEFEQWDGEIYTDFANPQDIKRTGTIRLFLDTIDPLTKQVSFRLRCRSAFEFPQDATLSSTQLGNLAFYCRRDIFGWSTTLKDSITKKAFDSNHFDWMKSFKLQNPEQGLEFNFKGEQIKVFTEATHLGIRGYAEDRRVPKNQLFYLAAHQEITEKIIRWGERECDSIGQIQVKRGLPPSWNLFSVKGVRGNKELPEFPILKPSGFARVHFQGGIRVAKGNRFFSFARPLVRISDGLSTSEISCSHIKLNKRTDDLYEFPSETPSDKRITIELIDDGQSYSKKHILLEDDFKLPTLDTASRLDKFGNSIEAINGSEESYLSGPNVFNSDSAEHSMSAPFEILPGTIIYIVGTNPGEIERWPHNKEISWSPVWALRFPSGRGKAQAFLMNALAKTEQINAPSKKKIAEWKDMIWHGRKRITPPDNPKHKALWSKFIDRIRDVK